jgi:hypothetical protein
MKNEWCELCKKHVTNLEIHLKYEHGFPPRIVRKLKNNAENDKS